MKPVELYPHQQKAVDELSNGKILWGDTGTGKSRTAMAYYYTKVIKGVPGDMGSIREPKDLYIITTAKKRDSLDWDKEALGFGLGIESEFNPESIRFVVDSWNNIGKYEDVENAFFIFDEQRLVGSGAWSQTFIKIAKKNNWILLTATPGDTWLDYIPVFVANGFYKNRTEFKRTHVVYNTFTKFPKVDRYVGAGKLVRLRNKLLVHMPYQKHTVQHDEIVPVPYDEALFERVVKDRWHVYENRPLRDVAELFIAMRKVVNSDISRLRALEELLRRQPRVIVFYNFDYELEILRSLVPANQKASPESLNQLAERVNSQRMDSTDGLRITTQSSYANDWEYLLSPEGRAENESALQSMSSSDSSTDGSISGSSLGIENGCETTGKKSVEISDMKRLLKETGGPISKSSISPWESPNGTATTLSQGNGTGSIQSLGKLGQDVSVPGVELDGLISGISGSQESLGSRVETANFAVAEWNGHKHEEIPDTDSWVYLVQYVAGAEGWNCVATDTVVFYSQTYSYKNFHQAHGRIDRLNTPFTDLWYYSFVSDSLIDKAISESLSNKKSFNESNLVIFE